MCVKCILEAGDAASVEAVFGAFDGEGNGLAGCAGCIGNVDVVESEVVTCY